MSHCLSSQILFTHPSVHGYLGGFHLWLFTQCCYEYICINIRWVPVLYSLGTHSEGNCQTISRLMFNLLRNSFSSAAALQQIQSCQQCTRHPFLVNFVNSWYFLFLIFSTIVFLQVLKHYLFVVLICSFPKLVVLEHFLHILTAQLDSLSGEMST